MTNAERKEILQQTRQAQQLGFKGSVVDVLANPAILQEFVQSVGNQRNQQNQNVEVAATPQQQQQGLRGRSQAELPAQMVFPNVSPNTPFNTVGMKAPINIEKYNEQGHLVKSYENVPPGITNLPMGPQRGTVIETPANMQSGGRKKYQSGSPTEYFEKPPLTSSDFDYTADRSRGNARFFSDPITGEPFPLVNLPAAEVVTQRTPYNQLSNQSLLAGVSQAKPWFEAGNKEMGYRVLQEREKDLQRASLINEFTGIPAMGRTADRIKNDPADLFSLEGGLDALSFIPSTILANKGVKALGQQLSPLVKNSAPAVRGTFVNPPASSKISKGVSGTSSLIDEVLGEIVRGKSNRKAIAEGNEWLENWIKSPVTQQKIENSLSPKLDIIGKEIDKANANKDFLYSARLLDEFDKTAAGMYQAQTFVPNSREYPLLKQLDQNLQQYLTKNAREPIHSGNRGVSYMHGYDPQLRRSIEQGQYTPSDRYGSWISRKLNIPQSKRVGTTIHEGTHDWVPAGTFSRSGMRNTALDNMDPAIKKDFLEWEDLRKKGNNPETVMGEQRAYQAYLADATEQHARIMELRKQLNITPDYEMDLEDAEKVLDWVAAGGSNIDSRFLNTIDRDPKKLAELFNKFWMAPAVAVGAGAAAVAGSEPKQIIPPNFRYGGPISYQNGGLPGEMLYRSTSAGAPLAYNSPTANGYLLPDPNRPELMNTGATEYKMGVDNDLIPTVVNGMYFSPEDAYNRYKLTGEKFKPTADPSAYSKFYDEINRLGIMKQKRSGGKKPKYKAPKMY
jgi:uncharacterized membrane protein (UPF0127 family)